MTIAASLSKYLDFILTRRKGATSTLWEGAFYNYERKEYDVSKTYELEETDFENVLEFVKEVEDKNYNLHSNNCTDFATNAVRIGGFQITSTPGKRGGFRFYGILIPADGVSDTGDAGEDLRADPSSNQTPGVAKPEEVDSRKKK